jgi:hypothetical protein
MNKRILELADKAVEDMPSGPWNIPDEFCKRFAELIVRECADIADEYDGVGSTIVSRIKKHFGVKE